MALPFVAVQFPGIEPQSVIGGEFTFSRGITPSVCVLRTLAQPSLTCHSGTLQITYDGNTLTWPNCAVQCISKRQGKDRHRGWTWEVHIADRRHRWTYFATDGVFNERLPDQSIRVPTGWPNSKQSARQLAGGLLTMMGESTFDVSSLPNDCYPFVEWKSAIAARRLAQVAEMFGCVVVLGLDNYVRVLPHGVGAALPDVPSARTPLNSYRHSARPASIVLECGPTLYQAALLLQAVGLETNGDILPINQLSYTPATGWETQWPDAFPDVNENVRHFAFQSVWRWYQVVAAADGTLNIPGLAWPLTTIEQIFPLRDTLIDTGEGMHGARVTTRSVVSGDFWQQCDLPENGSGVTYSGDFTIDHRNGIVKFPYPLIAVNTSGQPTEPELYLTTAFNVRDTNGQWDRYRHNRAIAGGIAGAKVVPRPYLWLCKNSSTFDSSAFYSEVTSSADAYGRTWDAQDAADRTYAGILPIGVDGAIAQVRWTFGRGSASTTRASRNTEADWYTPPYHLRRLREQAAQSWEDQ